jgi:hypothetical protein
MNYEIKNFENEDGNKFVGFKITDDKGSVFVIDKRVPLQDGKTNEQYVSDALAMCQDEIAEWQQSFALIGRKWNPETNAFE